MTFLKEKKKNKIAICIFLVILAMNNLIKRKKPF